MNRGFVSIKDPREIINNCDISTTRREQCVLALNGDDDDAAVAVADDYHCTSEAHNIQIGEGESFRLS